VTRHEPLRINLGSGKQAHPGWTGYDRSLTPLIGRLLGRDVHGWARDTRVRDLTRGLPHADGSVDAVYSSHTLEHLTRDDAAFVVSECYRVLRRGGTLRLVVPDLEVLVRAYIAKDREKLPGNGPIGDALMDGLLQRPRRHKPLRRLASRLLRSDDGGHRWMYDQDSLAHLVRQAGFRDVERVAFGQGRDADTAELDTRSAFHIHLEALKP
jgi:predicted SAM-dependent methyltransferase